MNAITQQAKMRKVPQRAHWTMTRNEQGEMLYVQKEHLRVDQTYQRTLIEKKRRRIASEFNWAAFGVLIVARRPDGTLWVIDGQHRHAAAMSRHEVERVPCIIFEFDGNLIDEAMDFVVANKNRKPLTGLESFKALVVSQDSIACRLQDLVLGTGRVIDDRGPTSNRVSCIKTLYECARVDFEALTRLWPLIIELSAGSSVDSRIVSAMHFLEMRLIDSHGGSRSLADREIGRKIRDAGGEKVLRAIGDASAYYQRGGARTWARGLLNVVNYKRINRLTIRGLRE